MGIFSDNVKAHIYDILLKWGMSPETAEIVDGIVVLLYIALFILVVNLLLRLGLIRVVHWVVSKTKVEWDNILFDGKVIKRLCGIVTPIIINMMLPLAISALDIKQALIISLLNKTVDVYIVVTFILFINAVFKSLFAVMVHRPAWQGKPIDGLLQTVQIVLSIIGSILIIAIIIDKSPAGLLTGLGAVAAVISFIFKDTLLGLVAGVQLSANNMLKVGDWIEMPSRGIDGMVEGVSLTTIKIRRWDNTVQTIPPYLLVSEPFSNWQAMFDRGGRRVKRSLNVDVTSVKFVTEEFLERLSNDQVIANLLKDIEVVSQEGEQLTNLDIYMRIINRYLDTHPRINHSMLAMVRQLQPTEFGLPIELYFFSSNVMWVHYEHLQAEIISRVIAIAPHLDIHLYQAPSGLDFKPAQRS